jgi:hypothetical protein
MRSGSTRLFTLSLLVLVASPAGCRDAKELERKEYRALKMQLTRISRTPTEKLGDEITRLGELDIRTERIDACRDACLEAYGAIASASERSLEAQAIIEDLEDTDEDDVEMLEKQQARALGLIEDSESELERAKSLKDHCHELLEDLEGEGLDRDR